MTLQVVAVDLKKKANSEAWVALLDHCARELGCCKLTLEVLSNNARAVAAYQRAGFAPYVLDPAAGYALFLQKPLLEN